MGMVIGLKIKFYGSRGSMPFFSRESAVYGGNTPCTKVETRGRTVIIDCGSGLFQYLKEIKPAAEPLNLDILISHLHIDHIIGLSMFTPIWNADNNIRIYTKSRSAGEPLDAQVFKPFKPPYWPLDIRTMNRARIIEIKDGEPFTLDGGVKVTPFASNHPDGTTSFKIESDKTLIHLPDHEHEDNHEKTQKLIDICGGADCVIYDGAYLPKDYGRKRGFGHSTYEHGMELARRARCRNMIFTHFDQKYGDADLDGVNAVLKSGQTPDISYYMARDGLEVEI
jgi:phosphoribosyl 1,2-cyclic phosphodiesterase